MFHIIVFAMITADMLYWEDVSKLIISSQKQSYNNKLIYKSTLTSEAIQRLCTIKPFMPKRMQKILQILKSNFKKMPLQQRLKDL